MSRPQYSILRLGASQRGYVLLLLLLTMALVIIAAAVAAPVVATEIRRSREEELIHRGMQYRRAIRRYIKQTGRYPMTIDDLNSNGVRCLRKKYKDPMTGRDFQLLHMIDLPNRVGSGRTTPPNLSGQGAADGSSDPNSPPPGDSSDTTADPTQQPPQQRAQAGPDGQSSTTLGGGVIIGVASTSSKKTIREFNRKNRYNQWLFYYDPAFDGVPEVYGPTPQGLPTVIPQNPPGAPAAGQPLPVPQQSQPLQQ